MTTTYLILMLTSGLICGMITRKINEDKGYNGGFAWGFFLGVIGIIVEACKPYNVRRDDYNNRYDNADYTNSNRNRSSFAKEENKRVMKSGGWKCNRCGRVNANYVTTCVCGVGVVENKEWNKRLENRAEAKISQADELKKFKGLLDSGAITQEEFDAKKKQILKL